MNHFCYNLIYYFEADVSSPGKPRGVTKSNTMSGGNRSLAPTSGGGSVARRSTISYDAKASSNEKTNTAGELPRYAKSLC